MSESSEPKRWRHDETGGASARARALVRAGGAPVPMTDAQRARGLASVARIAAMPVGGTPWLAWSGVVAVGVAAVLVVLVARRHPAAAPGAQRAVTATHAVVARPHAVVIVPDAPATPAVAPGTPAVATDAPSPAARAPSRASAVPVARVASPPSVLVATTVPPARRAHPTSGVLATATTEADAGASSDVDDRLARENRLVLAMSQSVATAPRRVLQLAAEYDAAFPHGEQYESRAWLEVEALQRLGRGDEARARATDALRRAPGGMYTLQLTRARDAPDPTHDDAGAR